MRNARLSKCFADTLAKTRQLKTPFKSVSKGLELRPFAEIQRVRHPNVDALQSGPRAACSQMCSLQIIRDRETSESKAQVEALHHRGAHFEEVRARI